MKCAIRTPHCGVCEARNARPNGLFQAGQRKKKKKKKRALSSGGPGSNRKTWFGKPGPPTSPQKGDTAGGRPIASQRTRRTSRQSIFQARYLQDPNETIEGPRSPKMSRISSNPIIQSLDSQGCARVPRREKNICHLASLPTDRAPAQVFLDHGNR